MEGDVLELAARLLERVGGLPPLGDVSDDPVDEQLASWPAPWAHAVPDPTRLAVVANQTVLDLDRLAGLELREDVVRLLVVRMDGFLPRLLGRLVLRKGAEEAFEPLADERVADVRPVLEVLGLVEMDGDGAGDAAEYIRRRERFVQRVRAVVRNGGGVGHGEGGQRGFIGNRARDLNPQLRRSVPVPARSHSRASREAITSACHSMEGEACARRFLSRSRSPRWRSRVRHSPPSRTGTASSTPAARWTAAHSASSQRPRPAAPESGG